MAKTLCFCRRYMISPESANYVRDGIPMCSAATCQKVAEHRVAREQHRPAFVVFDDGRPDETKESLS